MASNRMSPRALADNVGMRRFGENPEPTVGNLSRAMNQNSVRSQFPAAPEGRAPNARIAFVQSCWHRDIVDQSLVGFLKELEQQALDPKQVDRFAVPGAFEIPRARRAPGLFSRPLPGQGSGSRGSLRRRDLRYRKIAGAGLCAGRQSQIFR